MRPQPLEVGLLTDADTRRPMGKQRLEFERRRITIADHERWQHTGRPPHEGDADLDDIDLAVAAPDPPQKRSDRETSRVLEILDELERGQG